MYTVGCMDFHGVPGFAPRPRANRSRRAAGLTALLAASIGFAGLVAAPVSAANNPGTGDSGFFTFRPSEGVGGTQINVASGNALVRTRDLADGPLTYHVVVDRAYNSRRIRSRSSRRGGASMLVRIPSSRPSPTRTRRSVVPRATGSGSHGRPTGRTSLPRASMVR